MQIDLLNTVARDICESKESKDNVVGVALELASKGYMDMNELVRIVNAYGVSKEAEKDVKMKLVFVKVACINNILDDKERAELIVNDADGGTEYMLAFKNSTGKRIIGSWYYIDSKGTRNDILNIMDDAIKKAQSMNLNNK